MRLTPRSVNWRHPVDWRHPLNRGLISWWLNVPHWQGGAKWRDLAGRNDGTLTNMDPATGWVGPGGRPGGFGALDFDGTNDWVDAGDLAVFDGLAALTITAWVNPDTDAGAGSHASGNGFAIVDKSGSSGDDSVYFALESIQDVEFYIDNGSENELVTIGEIFEIGEWTHLTAVYDGVQQLIYRNGVLFASRNVAGSGGLVTNNNSVGIGAGRNGTANEFDGKLDDIRIYSRALSAAEIADYYERSQQGYPGLLTRRSPRTFFVPAAGGGVKKNVSLFMI